MRSETPAKRAAIADGTRRICLPQAWQRPSLGRLSPRMRITRSVSMVTWIRFLVGTFLHFLSFSGVPCPRRITGVEWMAARRGRSFQLETKAGPVGRSLGCSKEFLKNC